MQLRQAQSGQRAFMAPRNCEMDLGQKGQFSAQKKNAGWLLQANQRFFSVTQLDVEVLYVECILFDEFPACFHILAHKRGEDCLGLCQVFQLHRKQCAALWVHRRLP